MIIFIYNAPEEINNEKENIIKGNDCGRQEEQ
jgi:hypothetical protein